MDARMHATPAKAKPDLVGTNECSDEQELENLAAEGYIRFDHMDEKGQKIYVLTELGQCAMSENPFIKPALKNLAAEGYIRGYIRFDHMDESGQFTIRSRPIIMKGKPPALPGRQ